MVHDIDLGTGYYAPNDWYSFSAFVFVIDRATNESIPVIACKINSAGPGDFSAVSEVAPSGNEFTYDAGEGPTTVVVKSVTMYTSIRRPVTVLALTSSIFAINWILTACSLITTSVMSHWEGEIGIALLPITVILTIPTLRNIYVDLPFGVYLGGSQKHCFSPQRLMGSFRRDGILPANADSGAVHRDSVV